MQTKRQKKAEYREVIRRSLADYHKPTRTDRLAAIFIEAGFAGWDAQEKAHKVLYG